MKRQGSNLGLKLMWPLIFAAIFIKYAYYKYSYLPLLDDNNMYGIFRLQHNIFNDVILKYKMYTTRPIAALLDAYFWAKLWDNLWLSLVIITFLHFLSCVLIYKIFNKSGLKTGIFAVIIFALLPFGSEATYWLAASSRVVVGMFFLSLSLYILCIYFDQQALRGKKSITLILFFITHLISLGFYEQIIAFSFFALIILFVVNWSRLKSKWISALPLINFGLIAFWYKIFSSSGNMAARGQVVSGNYLSHFKNVTRAIYDVWKQSFIDLYQVSVGSGFQTLISNRSYLFAILIIGICVAVFFISKSEAVEKDTSSNIIKLALGVFLFAVSYAPFYAMSLIWICNRNIFISFIGLGLMLEAVLSLLSGKKVLNNIRSLVVSIIALVFLTSNIYELTYYRNIGLIDQKVTSQIVKIPEAAQSKQIVLLNSKDSYVPSIAKRIGNCTGSDWALSGALTAHHSKDIKISYAYPLLTMLQLPFERDKLKSSILLGIDDSANIFPLKIVRESTDNTVVSRIDGKEFGRVEFPEDKHAIFYPTGSK